MDDAVGSDVDLSNTYRYKKVSKSLLSFKNAKINKVLTKLEYI